MVAKLPLPSSRCHARPNEETAIFKNTKTVLTTKDTKYAKVGKNTK